MALFTTLNDRDVPNHYCLQSKKIHAWKTSIMKPNLDQLSLVLLSESNLYFTQKIKKSQSQFSLVLFFKVVFYAQKVLGHKMARGKDREYRYRVLNFKNRIKNSILWLFDEWGKCIFLFIYHSAFDCYLLIVKPKIFESFKYLYLVFTNKC